MLNTFIFIIQILLLAQTIMHPQTPEKPTKNIVNSFLNYPQKARKMRQVFLEPKGVQQLKETPDKIIETEYKVINSAEIDESIFNLNNLGANRYCDIFAYEHSRVNLTDIQNYYINGNQVKSLLDNQPFAIFSQAPFKNYHSFWEAVYYKNVDKIVMLCKFFDPDRGHQSQQYWPQQGQSKTFSIHNLKVTTLSSKAYDEEFTETIFKIEGPKGVKQVTHYHWTGWSDLKRPVDHKLERFQFLIDVCLKQIENNKLVWIHCSAGIGRTGTLGGVLDGIRYFRKYKKLSIFALVQNLRKYRYHAVQTFDQYRFLYSYLTKRL